MKRLSKIFLLFITIFSVLILVGGNDVFAFANQYIAWRKDVNGDGKPDLLFRRYSTATQEQLDQYYNEKSTEYLTTDDGSEYLGYTYKGKTLPSKWVHPETAGVVKPGTKEFVTIGYSFHTEQEGSYGVGIEGTTTAAMISYDENRIVTPITNSISNVLKYFNSVESIILKPNVWDDEDYAEINSANKEQEYNKVMPSLLYETYSNRGAVTQTNFGTRWNISTLKPDNKLVYRYAIMEIARRQGEVIDREYVYIEDRVIYHDELLELRAAMTEAGVSTSMYMSDIVISEALYDAGGYELSRTISQFFSQYKKHGYTTEFWPQSVVGTAEEATQTAINLFDNAITLPKSSTRNVIVRHIGIGNNSKVTEQVLSNSGYYLPYDTRSIKVKDSYNSEDYENVYSNAYVVGLENYWEVYLENIEVYQYMQKAANTYTDGHVAIGYNVATGSSLEDAAESLDIKLRWGSYSNMVGSNAVEIDGLIPESESEWVVIDFYYSKKPEVVYVNHLLVNLNNEVLPLERQMIRGNNTAYTGSLYTEPVSAITESFDSLTETEQIITMIQERYYRQSGQSLMVRTSMHLLDERFSLLEIFKGIRYVGYEIYDSKVETSSLIGKKVSPKKDWYKPFDVILGVILPANKTQVNFYYYNQDTTEATIPNKFISMKYEFTAKDTQGECTNDATGTKVTSIPSGQDVKTGVTNLYRVMASAINLEYIPETQNKHNVDVQLKYSVGNQTITLNANNIKYQFSYFRVDELVVDAIRQITLYDASSKWSSTSGSGIFSWSGNKLVKTYTDSASVTLSALGKTITNKYSEITNWKNYATVYIKDKDGRTSASNPEKVSLSASFLTQAQMNAVDANRDGKISSADKTFAAAHDAALKAAYDAAAAVNQWAIDTYNDKLALLASAESWYNSALGKSTVAKDLVNAATGSLNSAKTRLSNAQADISRKNSSINSKLTSISNLNSEIRTLEAEINTLRNVTIPNLASEKITLERELATLKSELETLQSQKSALDSELTSLQAEKTALQEELNSLNENATDITRRKAVAESELERLEAAKESYCKDTASTSAECLQATSEVNAQKAVVSGIEADERNNNAAISAKESEINSKQSEITAKGNEISSKQSAINSKNSEIASKEAAITNNNTATVNANNSVATKENSILTKQNLIATYESQIRTLQNEITQIRQVTIPAIQRDISYWTSVSNTRNNSFNLLAEAEVLLAQASVAACRAEVAVREAAKNVAEGLISVAETAYNNYHSYYTTLLANYDYCLEQYTIFQTIKDKAGLLKLKSGVAEVADYMGIDITFRVSNMLVKLNGSTLNESGDLEATKTVKLSHAMYNSTSLNTPNPRFKKQAYDGIGTKITLNDYPWSSVSKSITNGLRTLAAEVKYETKVLIKKDTLLYKSTTKSVVDNVYYSNYLDNPGSITNGTFQLDYDGLITKTSREVNIYTPIAASANLVSKSSKIQDQSTTNVASNSNLQTIQLGVPFTVTFGNKRDTADKVYRLTDMFKYTQGYYIKFDFDICNVKIKRNGSTVGWVNSKGTAKTGTAKNEVIKAGTWIGIITSGTSSTQLEAEIYSDVTDKNINVIDENERHSYVVRSVAYNATYSLKNTYATKYDILVDMLQYRSPIKTTVENICTDKATTGVDNVPSYFADKEYELVVLNRLYDFRVTDIKDVAWKSVFRENKNSVINAHTGNLYYSGIKKWVITADDLTKNVTRSSAEIGRDPTRILPIGAYKHTDKTYVKAPKLGYTFSYDMKVTGAYYDENGEPLTDKKVNITTKFYYVSNDGKTFLEEYKSGTKGIYLFYKNAAGKYVRIDNAGGGYELTFTPNDTYRYIEDGEKITLSNKVESLGNLRSITLKHNMATVNQSFGTPATANNGTIITYYGEYKLPNSTIAVEVDRNGNYDINKPLKNGYIGVVFDIQAVAGKYGTNSKITLSYGENSNGTNTSQWDYEGYLGFTKPGHEAKFSSASSIRLEDGSWNLTNAIYQKIKGTVILYDIDERAATDYE